METYDHFGHEHTLSFHKSLQGAELTCTGCKFPCTNTPIYSCRPCKFFLHKQCFHATRSMTHPLHPNHPLSLFPFSTYTTGSFLCNICNEPGSGFSFSCSACEFDLHIHCAYKNDINPKSEPSSDPPNQIRLKSHLNHLMNLLQKVTCDASQTCLCDVCGTECDKDSPLYHCDICGYDAHVACVNLLETVERVDHEHELSLLHVNPYESFGCDICKEAIAQNHCLYVCKSGCDYGMHVKCVSAAVTEVPEVTSSVSRPISHFEYQVQMMKLANSERLMQRIVDDSLGRKHRPYDYEWQI